jgi:hypothetical protein
MGKKNKVVISPALKHYVQFCSVNYRLVVDMAQYAQYFSENCRLWLMWYWAIIFCRLLNIANMLQYNPGLLTIDW